MVEKGLRELWSKGFDEKMIAHAIVQSITKKKRPSTALVEEALLMLRQEIEERIKSKVVCEIQHRFSPWKILWALDLAGGTSSFQAYDLIRKVEFKGLPLHEGSSRAGMCFPCLLKSWRSMQTLILYTLTKTLFKFDLEKIISFILTLFGLWKYVEKGESCQVAATLDGGQLSWKVTQISAGIKLHSK